MAKLNQNIIKIYIDDLDTILFRFFQSKYSIDEATSLKDELLNNIKELDVKDPFMEELINPKYKNDSLGIEKSLKRHFDDMKKSDTSVISKDTISELQSDNYKTPSLSKGGIIIKK